MSEHVWNAVENGRLDAHRRDSERRFKGLTSHAPVGIFETDAEGQCRFVNEKWCSLSGMTADAARGRGWVAAIHPEDRERVFNEWYEAARSGREFASEYRFKWRMSAPAGAVLDRGSLPPIGSQNA